MPTEELSEGYFCQMMGRPVTPEELPLVRAHGVESICRLFLSNGGLNEQSRYKLLRIFFPLSFREFQAMERRLVEHSEQSRSHAEGEGGSKAQDMTAVEALARHVFGPNDPSKSLLDTGRFPPGWVEEYRRLLELVAEECATAPLWPRHMVGALHYALTHLRVRYAAWQQFGPGQRDEETEQQLSRVEAPTRILFARAFPCQEPRHDVPESANDGGHVSAS